MNAPSVPTPQPVPQVSPPSNLDRAKAIARKLSDPTQQVDAIIPMTLYYEILALEAVIASLKHDL